VLNAETQVLAARRNQLDIVSNQVLARVTLLLALGGSFDPAAPGTAATPATAALVTPPGVVRPPGVSSNITHTKVMP
jgi:hypothetical protein